MAKKRMLHHSILEIDCTDFEFRVLVGLILIADDYGNCHADPVYLANRICPFARRKVKLIVSAMSHWERAGTVIPFTAKGMRYLHLAKWEDYQALRHRSQSNIPQYLPETLPQNDDKQAGIKPPKLSYVNVNVKGARPLLQQDELAALILAIEIIKGKKRKPTKLEIKTWKRLRRDFEICDIINCMRWAVHDDFWGQNVKGLAPLARAKISGDAIKFEKVWDAYQRSPAIEQERHDRAVQKHTDQRKKREPISEDQRERNLQALRDKAKRKPLLEGD